MGTRPFRFAVAVLTAGAFFIAAWAHHGGPGSPGHYLLASYALGQSLNVIFPHLVVTVAARAYAPGLSTGLVLVLPTATAFLFRSFALRQLRAGRLLIVSALFIPMMLLSIPILFRIGRKIT